MDIGIFTTALNSVDDLVADANKVQEAGFSSMWAAQIFGVDALTAIAVAAREVPDLHFGTDVVPVYRQHAMMLAQQALTVSQVAPGRLTLGIGLSHQIVVESMWGLSYERPLRYMREYLDGLLPLLNGEAASVGGEVVTARGELGVAAPAPRLMLAALGPKMLELAGRRADGTLTWMVGPETLANHIAPTINGAAAEAGRPAPAIGAGIPICVTDQVDAARARAAEEYAVYGQLPSYRAMLDREGLNGPEDLAVIGSADEIAERLNGLLSAGATSIMANEFGNPDERAATRAALASLLS